MIETTDNQTAETFAYLRKAAGFSDMESFTRAFNKELGTNFSSAYLSVLAHRGTIKSGNVRVFAKLLNVPVQRMEIILSPSTR